MRRLVSQQPGCFVYASDGLVGASPELLVRRIGDEVESLPVAGTAVADGDDASLRALAASVKDHREHRFVVDAIVEALEECCVELDAGSVPEVAVFGHVAHLATRVSGRLRAPAPSALEHRPAVAPEPRGRRHAAGRPRSRPSAPSRDSIGAATPGRSAGSTPAGTANGRSRSVAPSSTARRARLVAGAGIVTGSEPDAEWAETQAKLEPMLRALVRP